MSRHRAPTNSYNKNEVGSRGELLASNYIIARGHTLLAKNYRALRYEVDIISLKDNIVHFIEVKTRTSLRFGQPESHVSAKKIKRMLDVAGYFLEETPIFQETNIQFDIVAILLRLHQQPQITLIEDIYT